MDVKMTKGKKWGISDFVLGYYSETVVWEAEKHEKFNTV
jgi:hypothetical protein